MNRAVDAASFGLVLLFIPVLARAVCLVLAPAVAALLVERSPGLALPCHFLAVFGCCGHTLATMAGDKLGALLASGRTVPFNPGALCLGLRARMVEFLAQLAALLELLRFEGLMRRRILLGNPGKKGFLCGIQVRGKALFPNTFDGGRVEQPSQVVAMVGGLT